MLKTLRSREHEVLRNLLADIRKEADFTQEQLADLMGVPQSFVSKVEIGERKIDPVEVVRWAKECKLTARQFYARLVTALEKL